MWFIFNLQRGKYSQLYIEHDISQQYLWDCIVLMLLPLLEVVTLQKSHGCGTCQLQTDHVVRLPYVSRSKPTPPPTLGVKYKRTSI
jgi:hypothetical protein